MSYQKTVTILTRLLILPIIVLVLVLGFTAYTNVVFEQQTRSNIFSNLSQLPTTDIGYVYFDEEMELDENLTTRVDELLRSKKLDHLFIGFHPSHLRHATQLKESLLLYKEKVALMPARENLVLSLYELCNNHDGCTFTIIGEDKDVQQSIYIAQSFDQSAYGYLAPDYNSNRFSLAEMSEVVETYLMLNLFEPEEYDLLLTAR